MGPHGVADRGQSSDPSTPIREPQTKHISRIDPVGVGDMRVERPDRGPAPGLIKVVFADAPEGVPLLHIILLRDRGQAALRDDDVVLSVGQDRDQEYAPQGEDSPHN